MDMYRSVNPSLDQAYVTGYKITEHHLFEHTYKVWDEISVNTPSRFSTQDKVRSHIMVDILKILRDQNPSLHR